MRKDTEKGIIYTFYSYKGGAGRTMSLANTAALLAKWGYSVLVVDWDLEAPGLERFFYTRTEARELRRSYPGMTDLIIARSEGQSLEWRDCVATTKFGVFLISAGTDDGSYFSRVQSLDFSQLFAERSLGEYIESLRNEWLQAFDYILIDSRTGLTDIGGICTVHLPDILVILFTATDSSIDGNADIIERARAAHGRLPIDRNPLLAIPVLSRDESRTEYQAAARWKKTAADRFQEIYRDWLPKAVEPTDAIETLKIPYVPYWSFGEHLPSISEDNRDPGSLGYAYDTLARLLAARLDWNRALDGQKTAPPPIREAHSITSFWLENHRKAALAGLDEVGKSGYMEVYHYCENQDFDFPQGRLVDVARQSTIHTFGWPIGLVLDGTDMRPRPNNAGILAEVKSQHNSYDYWALTRKADFYTLLSLFEDERAENLIFFNIRIMRVAEAIRHCTNIYKLFGAEPNATIALSVKHGGLRGRRLAATGDRMPLLGRENKYEDEVTSPLVKFNVGIDANEVARLVKIICEPLFIIFDFAQFSDQIYADITSKFLLGE